ncbi:uncharacterized protein HaLaN_31047 [Haematococcus lacustris]|uniref:Uncharacterized protein n=1 Tax=Haematococcus lacustris TaxID=44745 RepID=A0A6A0AJ97_HAELA|nr:uncharacterized protein HaLaN_31047 [Haematococcus lacustris]
MSDLVAAAWCEGAGGQGGSPSRRLQGKGVAHLEAQYGRGFPGRWLDPGSGVAVAVDPRDPAVPGLGVREQMDACRGTLNLTLSTLWHVVQIEMAAPPGSFTPVACPTQHGFVTLSVESYAAAARVRIWQRTLPAKIANMRMEGAALEYGGTYRCDQEVEAEQW